MVGKWIWKNMASWRLHRIEACFAYFCLMELLQFIQYLVIDQRDNAVNTYSTALGYLHICFQPFFTNLIMSAIDRKNLDGSRESTWKSIFKFLVAFLMTGRIIIPAIVSPDVLNTYFESCYRDKDRLCAEKNSWKTCSTTGIHHIRWNFKLLQRSYLFPNIGLHVCDSIFNGNAF